jgi:hypothetical protein
MHAGTRLFPRVQNPGMSSPDLIVFNTVTNCSSLNASNTFHCTRTRCMNANQSGMSASTSSTAYHHMYIRRPSERLLGPTATSRLHNAPSRARTTNYCLAPAGPRPRPPCPMHVCMYAYIRLSRVRGSLEGRSPRMLQGVTCLASCCGHMRVHVFM